MERHRKEFINLTATNRKRFMKRNRRKFKKRFKKSPGRHISETTTIQYKGVIAYASTPTYMKGVVWDQCCRKSEQKEAPSTPAFDRQSEEQIISTQNNFKQEENIENTAKSPSQCKGIAGCIDGSVAHAAGNSPKPKQKKNTSIGPNCQNCTAGCTTRKAAQQALQPATPSKNPNTIENLSQLCNYTASKCCQGNDCVRIVTTDCKVEIRFRCRRLALLAAPVVFRRRFWWPYSSVLGTLWNHLRPRRRGIKLPWRRTDRNTRLALVARSVPGLAVASVSA